MVFLEFVFEEEEILEGDIGGIMFVDELMMSVDFELELEEEILVE